MVYRKVSESENKNRYKDIKEIYFQRAIFVSWYCSIGDCKFCYMSTQKNKIKNPSMAKRRLSSVLAEIYVSRKVGWKIEFISAGYSGVSDDELHNILKYGSLIYGEKLWLNTGFMPEEKLNRLRDYICGVSASIETLNNKVHEFVCPSKPIEPYLRMFEVAKGLKRSITLIIGLGETKEDIKKTIEFIRKNKLDRITLYALRPVKGTYFERPPELEYYAYWIRKIKEAFPDIELIAGIYNNDLGSLQIILDAGADSITKYPSIKKFEENWNKYVKGYLIKGNRIPEFKDIRQDLSVLGNKELEEETFKKINMYIKIMKK